MLGSPIWVYVVILLIVVLIIFGPGRLPELGGAVGKAMREFRKATTELTNEVTTAAQATPAAPPPAQLPRPAAESATKASTDEATASRRAEAGFPWPLLRQGSSARARGRAVPVEEQRMSVIEHLEALRRALIISLIAWAVDHGRGLLHLGPGDRIF